MTPAPAPFVCLVDLEEDAEAIRRAPFSELQRERLPSVTQGLVDASRVLVLGSTDQVADAQDVFERILLSASVRQLLCVAVGPADEPASTLEFPRALRSDGAGVLWVGDPRGVLWRTGASITQALTVTEADPRGDAALGTLTDCLRAPEVFDAVHAAIRRNRRVVSPALRVLVPGASSALLRHAESRAVEELTTVSSGQLAVEIDADATASDGQSFLFGDAPEPTDLFEPNGVIETDLRAVRAAHAAAAQALRPEALRPLLADAEEARAAVRTLGERLAQLKSTLRSQLFERIDGSNGLDPAEIRLLRQAGLRPAAISPATELEADESENRLRELAMGELARHQSLLAVIGELRALAVRARPRTREQALHALDDACPDSLLTTLTAYPTLRIRLGAPPSLLAALVVMLTLTWFPGRYVAVPLLLLPLGALLLLSRTGATLPMIRRHLRRHVDRGGATVAFVTAGAAIGLWLRLGAGWTPGPLVAPIVFPLACATWLWSIWRDSVSHWVSGTRLQDASSATDELIALTRTVTMNDWVLANPRVRFAATCSHLADVLEEIRVGLLGDLGPGSEEALEPTTGERMSACNPAVRVDLSASAAGGLRRYGATMSDIIAEDYVDLIRRSVAWTWIEIVQGSPRSAAVIETFRSHLSRYRGDLRENGLFRTSALGVSLADLGIEERGVRQRVALLADVWHDAEGIDELLSSPASSDLVQLCAPEHLLWFDADLRKTEMVRFVPLTFQRAPDHVPAIQTDSMFLAGIVRLVPLRAGTFRFSPLHASPELQDETSWTARPG